MVINAARQELISCTVICAAVGRLCVIRETIPIMCVGKIQVLKAGILHLKAPGDVAKKYENVKNVVEEVVLSGLPVCPTSVSRRRIRCLDG